MLELYPHTPDDVIAKLTCRPWVVPKVADVVIVGGGIMGAASAYYLSKIGLKVVLIEKNRIAGQQSGRNWGFVRTQYRDPNEVSLSIEALSLWPALATELGYETGWLQNGCIFLAKDQDEEGRFEQWYKQTKDLAQDARLVPASQVRKLLPSLNANFVSALYTPSDGQAEPVLATTAFARAAEGRGVQILEGCGVLNILTAGGAVSGVLTEYGEIQTKAVVCAAGSSSYRLLEKLDLFLPQQIVCSTVSITKAIPKISEICLVGLGLGLRQRPDGSCIIAAEGEVDHDVTLDSFRGLRHFLPGFLAHRSTCSLRIGRALVSDIGARLCGEGNSRVIQPRRPKIIPNNKRASKSASLLKNMFEMAGQVSISKTWAGQIDVLPDALPVIDAPTEVSGLVIATGFSGHGFGVAPAVGKITANLVSGAAPLVSLENFRLDRFRLGNYGRPHAPL